MTKWIQMITDNVRSWLVSPPPPLTIFRSSLMWKFSRFRSWIACYQKKWYCRFQLIWTYFQLIFNWFQFTFNWFQFTFNWSHLIFHLLSIDLNLLSIDFQSISIYFQLIAIYFQLISLDFQLTFNWFSIDLNLLSIDFNLLLIKHNLTQFIFFNWKTFSKNPGDTIVNPPSFQQIQNYFRVWGHNSVPPH